MEQNSAELHAGAKLLDPNIKQTALERLDFHAAGKIKIAQGPDRFREYEIQKAHDRLLIQAALEAVGECWEDTDESPGTFSDVLRSWGKK
jgi:hypothetical protein